MDSKISLLIIYTLFSYSPNFALSFMYMARSSLYVSSRLRFSKLHLMKKQFHLVHGSSSLFHYTLVSLYFSYRTKASPRWPGSLSAVSGNLSLKITLRPVCFEKRSAEGKLSHARTGGRMPPEALYRLSFFAVVTCHTIIFIAPYSSKVHTLAANTS